MALKVTSQAWVIAGEENRAQRNTARAAFFAQAGVKPAKSMRHIFSKPDARAAQFKKAMQAAQKNKVGEKSLDDITLVANAALTLAGLGIPSLSGLIHSQPLGILAVSPEVLKMFFATEHDTALELSIIE